MAFRSSLKPNQLDRAGGAAAVRRPRAKLWARFQWEYESLTGRTLGQADEPDGLIAEDFRSVRPSPRGRAGESRLRARARSPALPEGHPRPRRLDSVQEMSMQNADGASTSVLVEELFVRPDVLRCRQVAVTLQGRVLQADGWLVPSPLRARCMYPSVVCDPRDRRAGS